MLKLLTCPYCDEDEAIMTYPGESSPYYQVICTSCGACSSKEGDEQDAVAMWNLISAYKYLYLNGVDINDT